MSAALVTTTCSGCAVTVKVSESTGLATARVPSNGKRGSLHVPAHTVTADLSWPEYSSDALVMWDCPACGYADSYDPIA